MIAFSAPYYIVVSGVTYPAVPHFSTLSRKLCDFREKKLLDAYYVFWFSLQLLSEKYFIPRIIQRDIIINVHWSSYKVSVMLVRC